MIPGFGLIHPATPEFLGKVSKREFFHNYSAQCKRIVPDGYIKDRVEGLTRYTPNKPDLFGIVTFSELSEQTVEAAITEQLEYFKSIERDFEWKLYEFDTPDDLGRRLEDRGFSRGESEAFMLYELKAHRPSHKKSGFRIELVTTSAGIDDIVQLQQSIYGQEFPWLKPVLVSGLDRSAIFCAYHGDQAVGCGWMDFHEGTDFSELHGGTVLPEFRGRGIYSDLFDIRGAEAVRRGIGLLTVDAAPMSRPILMRKGFIHICETIPYRKTAG
jgi:hypothetical protein